MYRVSSFVVQKGKVPLCRKVGCVMRIAIFSECYTPVPNGVVTSIVNLRETLRSWGHTVYVFAPGSRQPEDDEHIFRLPELPFPRHPYHFARPFPRVKTNFPALKVDVIHCQHPFVVGNLGAELSEKHNIPMVYTAHSRYDMMVATAKSQMVRTMVPKAMQGIVRRFCGRADYVITPSKNTRDALREEGIRARYVVIPSGVRPPAPRPNARVDIRSQLGIPPEKPVLLYLGRLGPEKRVDLILESVAMMKHIGLPEPLRDFHVILAGDGQCRHDLEVQTAELGIQNRVTFTGMIPPAEVGNWYSASDIFVFPSALETQGMVLLEAMTMGLPCITVNEGGASEMVVEGETGFCIPQTCHAFAKSMNRLLIDPALRQKFGEAGRVRAERFTPEAMAERVLDVYNRAADRPRSPHQSRVKRITLEMRRRRVERLRTRLWDHEED